MEQVGINLEINIKEKIVYVGSSIKGKNFKNIDDIGEEVKRYLNQFYKESLERKD